MQDARCPADLADDNGHRSTTWRWETEICGCPKEKKSRPNSNLGRENLAGSKANGNRVETGGVFDSSPHKHEAFVWLPPKVENWEECRNGSAWHHARPRGICLRCAVIVFYRQIVAFSLSKPFQVYRD